MNDIIKNRRSVRRYLDKDVEQEKIEQLLRAAMQAPSAKNQQPWEFLVVRDAEAKKAIAKASPYASMVEFAPVVIVTMVDLDRADQYTWWIGDMAACTQNILLQAVDLGLGACWCGYYPYGDRSDAVREYFGMPEKIVPYSVIPVGYPAKETKFADRWDESRVHYEKY